MKVDNIQTISLLKASFSVMVRDNKALITQNIFSVLFAHPGIYFKCCVLLTKHGLNFINQIWNIFNDLIFSLSIFDRMRTLPLNLLSTFKLAMSVSIFDSCLWLIQWPSLFKSLILCFYLVLFVFTQIMFEDICYMLNIWGKNLKK